MASIVWLNEKRSANPLAVARTQADIALLEGEGEGWGGGLHLGILSR